MSEPERRTESGKDRLTRAWRFLTEHHAVVGLLTTILLGLFGSYISCRIAQITDDQRRMQELTLAPQIVVELRPSDHFSQPDTNAVDLLIENVGGPLNRLSLSIETFMTLTVRSAGQRDSSLAIVPLA